MNEGVMKTNYELYQEAQKEEKSFAVRVLTMILWNILWFIVSRIVVMKYIPSVLLVCLTVVLISISVAYLAERFKVLKHKRSLCDKYTILCAGNTGIERRV